MDNTSSLYSQAQSIELEPRRYYAFIETVEDYSDLENPNRFFVRFDCVRASDGLRFSSLGKGIALPVLNEGPFVHIECVSNAKSWNEFFNEAGLSTQEAESRWCMIETRQTLQGIVANEFYNGIAMLVQHAVVALKATPEEQKIIDGLGSSLSLDYFPDSTQEDIENALAIAIRQIDSVMVANVGQGSMNCFFQGSMVSCYFDIGGGTSMHASTYPNVLRTCKTNSPSVILSHWDMDHIETAVRDAGNCALTWIVPRQPVGLTHFTLALRISTTGSLVKWPVGTSNISIGNNHIVQCTGSAKNDSGLAMIIGYKHGNILLPADAAYNHIPGLSKYSLSCLVASHHGATSGSLHVPLASNKCWVVYSYGSDLLLWSPDHNRWGHPTSNSVRAHDTQGWLDNLFNRRDTMGGHVVFDSTNVSAGCGGRMCDLSSTQHF